MKFKCTIHHHNNRKGLGIVRADETMKDFLSLDDYCYSLVNRAVMFAVESGVSVEEANQAIQAVATRLQSSKVME